MIYTLQYYDYFATAFTCTIIVCVWSEPPADPPADPPEPYKRLFIKHLIHYFAFLISFDQKERDYYSTNLIIYHTVI